MDPQAWNLVSDILAEALEREDPAAREALLSSRCAGQPALRAEVGSLLASYLRSGSLEDTALAATPRRLSAGDMLGPYRITCQIGTGGMGIVYRAERADGQFERSVAIKVIGEILLSEDAVRRFRSERAILASLRHPNITQLIDAGVTAAGMPYLVMELVEGIPITEYCEIHHLNLRQRLALFREVCPAVQYAHQHLIIHRDLKPSNILIDGEGIPKLLDFGVARLLDSQASAGATKDLRRFTPNFASPEQLRGESLSTSSDIYSLGVVLYCLLAGDRPYDLTAHSFADAIRYVTEEEPPLLRRKAKPEAAAALEGELELIVRKAMAKSPAGRYVSARELAGDIDSFLAGRPVTAHAESKGYLLRKFVSRNARASAAVLCAVTLLIAGMASALYQNHVANIERQKAEQRFEQVRHLANSILFEFQQDLAKLAGATEIRRKMIARAMEHLEALSRQASDVSFRRELAAAYSRLGDVQGGANWSLGDRKGAMASFEKSRQILNGILAEQPQDKAASLSLAMVTGRMATIAHFAGWPDEAARWNAERERLVLQLFERFPHDEGAMEAMANVWFMRAQAPQRLEDQSACLQKALDLFEKLLRAHPAERARMYDVSVTSKSLASAAINLKDYSQARVHAKRAADLDRMAAEGDPLDARARLDYAFSLSTLASIESDTGNLSRAQDLFQQSVEIRRTLWAAEPQNARIRIAYVSGLYYLGGCLARAGSKADARRLLFEALAILQKYNMREPQAQHLRGQIREMLAARF
ncbi:MAG: serine/threonine protein kinase [Bryobacterales bacterium]|nr:serine/threonine protein kinase [Bryobacterales bacterium]